jgi:hypothetical protein
MKCWINIFQNANAEHCMIYLLVKNHDPMAYPTRPLHLAADPDQNPPATIFHQNFSRVFGLGTYSFSHPMR